jgi:uncharacterized membrane protein YfcA
MVYAATASVLALCVDLSRIPVYIFFRPEEISEHFMLTIILVASALLGVKTGKKWLKSMKSETIQNIVLIGIIASGIFYVYEALS